MISSCLWKKSKPVCATCQKHFQSKSALVIHESVHTREKSYSCGICDKNFAQKGSLKLHQRIHSGLKSYQRDVCK